MRSTPTRILFVDDDEDTRLMIELWLGGYGYEVKTAARLANALDLAARERFDLYLLDTHLPDGTGAELCRCIRALDRTTPVIFYSGDTPERLRAALAYGAQDYVVKPELVGLRNAIFRQVNQVVAA